MDFEVTIENFEGPLDLMLHLIKENQLDLFNLNFEELTKQYIFYIHNFTIHNIKNQEISGYFFIFCKYYKYKKW